MQLVSASGPEAVVHRAGLGFQQRTADVDRAPAACEDVTARDGERPVAGLVAANSLVDFSLQIQAVALTFMALLGAGVAQSKSSRLMVGD